MVIGKGTFEYLKAKTASTESCESWTSFHFNTRLKLNGVDYFLRQLRGATFRPDHLGLPLLAYSFRQWYLDAFFLELMSAYESLIQELNAICECGVKMTDHHMLSKVKQKLPPDLVILIEEERKRDWFRKLQWYRNSVSHRFRTPSDDMTAGSGPKPWHYDEYEVSIYYFDEDVDNWKNENIKVCEVYFGKMLDHVNAVWEKMKEQCFLDPD